MGKGSEGNPAPTMDTTAVAKATDGAPVMRVAIAGAGFSGAILARQLRRETGVEVVCYEKMAQSVVRKHWTQPVTGAGLNLNPNSLACLRQVDPELESMIRGIGLPRRSVTALTVTGRALYQQDVMAEGLSDAQGCRVRWDDANTLIRREAGDCMRWETTVDGHTVDAAGKVTVTLGHADGSTSTEGDFDLLVAGEGRYSPVRTRVTGTPPTTYGDVCNFRILVPNAQPDGSPWPADCPSGLFDDLQLVYNDTPTVENLAPDSTLRQDPLFTDVVMRSTPRVGIMRIPASKFKKEVGESLYIFGNFAIPAGGDIPASSKTGEAMHCMFTPAGGDEALTPEGRFIRETLARNADKLHWSRFQDIPVEFADQSGHVLMLGDAAHAFCPSLGQGASTSIEDACLAGTELRLAVRKARASGAPRSAVASSVPTAVAQIASRQAERVAFIRDMSTEAGEHIRFGKADRDGVNCLAEDVAAWTDDEHASGWRDKVRRMWLGYPKLEPLH